MPEDIINKDLKKALTRLCYLIILAATVYALYTLRSFISTVLSIAAPFLVGFIVAYLFDPIVTWIQRRFKISRIFGLIVVLLIIFAIIALFLLWILPMVYNQLVALIKFAINEFPDKIGKLMQKYKIQLTPEQQESIREYFDSLELNTEEIINTFLSGLKAVAAGGASAAGSVTRGMLTTIGAVFSFFTFMSFVVVISFYLIVDFSKIRPSIEPIIPPEKRTRVFEILDKVDIAVGGFLRGQLIDCVLVGALTAVLLFFAGFKEYAILIGFVAGVGNIVPYLGPILGASPAVMIVLLSSRYPSLIDKFWGLIIVAGIFVFVQSVEGFIFQPKVVGKKSQLHPILVLLALLTGGQFGIGGLIIAIPVAAAVRVLINELYWQPLLEKHNPPEMMKPSEAKPPEENKEEGENKKETPPDNEP